MHPSLLCSEEAEDLHIAFVYRQRSTECLSNVLRLILLLAIDRN